jgi:hypothetical protein
MGERTEDGSYHKQDENDDGDQIAEYDSRPTAASQGPVRDPDCKKRVRGGEGVAKCWILVLNQENHLVSLVPALWVICGKTCNLGNGIDRFFAWLIVCFKPKNERSGWLTSKGLHCCGG